MGQPAYDMSSEVRRRKAPQTQRKVALRVEKGGKRRLNPVQAAMQHLLQLISMALLAGLAVSALAFAALTAAGAAWFARSEER